MESMEAMATLRPEVGQSRSVIIAEASDLVVETQIIDFSPEVLDDLEVLVVLLQLQPRVLVEEVKVRIHVAFA